MPYNAKNGKMKPYPGMPAMPSHKAMPKATKPHKSNKKMGKKK